MNYTVLALLYTYHWCQMKMYMRNLAFRAGLLFQKLKFAISWEGKIKVGTWKICCTEKWSYTVRKPSWVSTHMIMTRFSWLVTWLIIEPDLIMRFLYISISCLNLVRIGERLWGYKMLYILNKASFYRWINWKISKVSK